MSISEKLSKKLNRDLPHRQKIDTHSQCFVHTGTASAKTIPRNFSGRAMGVSTSTATPKVFPAQPEFLPRPSETYLRWGRSRCPSHCPLGHPHEPQSRTHERCRRDGAGPPNELQLGFFAKQLMASWMFWSLKSHLILQRQPLKSNTKGQIVAGQIGLAPPQGANPPKAQTKILSITAFFCSSV